MDVFFLRKIDIKRRSKKNCYNKGEVKLASIDIMLMNVLQLIVQKKGVLK